MWWGGGGGLKYHKNAQEICFYNDTVQVNPNPPDPLPLLAPADLFAIPFSTVWVSFLDQVGW